MNYRDWRNDEVTRLRMKTIASWLSSAQSPAVIEQEIESLLLSAWIDGTKQGAAEEAVIAAEEGS